MPNKTTHTLILKINNINVEKVEELNFLGLTIDTNLYWNKNTDKNHKQVLQNYRNTKQIKPYATLRNKHYFI